jgi:SAM-dependent methyltransferase
VQLEEFVPPEEIFTEYAYFSSYSDTWLSHARSYVEMVTSRFGLSARSNVVELASNDGYLLQYFVEKGIPVLGVEPAANVATAAVSKGIPTLVKFFGERTARDLVSRGTSADLIVGNNVLAQVPDLNDFVRGMKILLKPEGVITMEFPHLLRLIEENQFDTIYHEHFSYFSFLTAEKVFAAHGLVLFDVEEIPTHGGSLRIFGCHADDGSKGMTDAVRRLKEGEAAFGLDNLERYASFDENVRETKRKLLEFLIRAKREGKRIAGYGAPGKGNTLLNYCGIRTDFIDFTVDMNPYKQGKFLPGTHIPIYSPEKIRQNRPDYVLIMPWNFREEIMRQLEFIRDWGGKFVIFIPEVAVYS